MKKNFASINVIIDESGSMHPLSADTIGGFNAFLAEQKAFPGEAILTLAKFSHEVSYVYDCVDIKDVAPLSAETYRPNGGTALLDAVGDVITRTGQRLAAMEEEARPDKVVVLIITDGEENRSWRHTKESIKAMIEHQRDKYSWNFVFIGANVDAFHGGTSLGVAGHNAVQYTASTRGTQKLYSSISASTNAYRGGAISLNDAYLGGNSIEVDEKIDVKAKTAIASSGVLSASGVLTKVGEGNTPVVVVKP
jgi:uncharacterized protein YegL